MASLFRLPPVLAVPLADLYLRRLLSKSGCQNAPIRRRRSRGDSRRQAAFEQLWQTSLARGETSPLIDYTLPYPKIEFLHYLCDDLGLVAHGSVLTNLEELHPIRNTRDESEFGNRQQIFASPDADWATWFAVVDKSRISRTSNGSIRVGPLKGDWTRLYFFHLPRDVQAPEKQPFCDGMIYIARAEDFPDHRETPQFDWLGVEIEEWGSTQRVIPLARLPFGRNDFPYMDQVEFIL